MDKLLRIIEETYFTQVDKNNVTQYQDRDNLDAKGIVASYKNGIPQLIQTFSL